MVKAGCGLHWKRETWSAVPRSTTNSAAVMRACASRLPSAPQKHLIHEGRSHQRTTSTRRHFTSAQKSRLITIVMRLEETGQPSKAAEFARTALRARSQLRWNSKGANRACPRPKSRRLCASCFNTSAGRLSCPLRSLHAASAGAHILRSYAHRPSRQNRRWHCVAYLLAYHSLRRRNEMMWLTTF